MEIWKQIDDRYSISNLGNVKSNYANKEKILKPYKDCRGYLKVDLCHGNSRKSVSVHRLVAMAFIPNPNNFSQVNHKDEDKNNNCVDNLEWCTLQYNCAYGTRNKRKAIGCYKKIYSVDSTGNIQYFNSIIEASQNTGIGRTSISKALSDNYPQNKTAGSLKWFYVEANK